MTMSSSDPLHPKTSTEEEYFHRKQQELIEKMRIAAENAAQRHALAEATNVTDDAVLDTMLELGFDRDTVTLLHLVPLVQVAWSEDLVTDKERKKIHALAKLRGVTPGTTAFETLESWLNERPRPEWFEKVDRTIGAVLATLPEEKRTAAENDIIAQCTEVAGVSGGFLGLVGAVSDIERNMIRSILELVHQGEVT
jgi:hypothetical protein